MKTITPALFNTLHKLASAEGLPDFFKVITPAQGKRLLMIMDLPNEPLPTSLEDVQMLAQCKVYEAHHMVLAWCQCHVMLWESIREQGFSGSLVDNIQPNMTRRQWEHWAVAHGVSDILCLPRVNILNLYLGDGWERYVAPDLCCHMADHLTGDVLWSKTSRARDRSEYTQSFNRVLMIARMRAKNITALTTIQHKISKKSFPPQTQKLADELLRLSQKMKSLGVLPNKPLRKDNDDFTLDLARSEFIYQTHDLAVCAHDKDESERLTVSISFASGSIVVNPHCHFTAHCGIEAIAVQEAMSFLLEMNPKVARTLEDSIGTPPWQNMLNVLLAAPPEVIPSQLDGAPAWFGWRVTDVHNVPQIQPVIVRHKKRGDGVVIKLLKGIDDTEALLDAVPTALDRQLVMYWRHAEQMEGRWWSSRHNEMLMDAHRALASLRHHEHVYYYDKSAKPLRFHYEEASLHFEEHADGQISLSLMFGDDRIEQEDLRHIEEELYYSQYIIRTLKNHKLYAALTMWYVPRRIEHALERADMLLHQALPAQSKAHLISIAPNLTADNHISLSHELRGREVSARHQLVARLSMTRGIMDITLLISPLPEGATYTPGEPPEVVYALVASTGDVASDVDAGSDTIHAIRLLDQEHQKARWFIDEMDFEDLLTIGTYQWRMDGVDASLDALEQLQHIQRQYPERLQVVWDQSVAHISRSNTSSLKLTVKPSQRFFSLDGALEFDGHVVPLDQLLQAIRQRRQWIQLDEDTWARMSEELTQSINSIGAFVGEQDDELQLSPLMAPSLMKLQEEGVHIDGPASWVALTDQIQEAALVSPAAPERFMGTLRDYQLEGLQWLCRLAMWAPGACLADDMGLGKTIQALAFILTRDHAGPTLIIGPTSLGFNWQRETEQFAPSLTFHLIRASAQLDKLDTLGASDVLYMSYDLAARNAQWSKTHQWSTMVLDEAQSIKNANTQRARAIHDIEAQFSLVLTGTPLENHTGELWSLMRVVAPSLLGDLRTFNTRFRIPIERDQDAVAQTSLAAMISPFVLRRLKRDVAADLPERTDVRLDVELSRGERAIYEQFRQSALTQLVDGPKEHQKRFELLAAITRLRQLACHPQLVDPTSTLNSSKLQTLLDLLLRIREEGHAALVFSQFTSLLHLLEDALYAEGFDVAKLTGSTTAKKRADLVESFQRGEHDVFLLSIKAGGIGLNLTRASYVFLLDPWWNPAVEDQAADRIHRIGQTEPVTIYRLVALNTIEEVIYQMHEDKRALMDAVLAGSGSSAPLSVDELHALLAEDFSSAPDDAQPDVALVQRKDRDSTPTSSRAVSMLDHSLDQSPDTGPEALGSSPWTIDELHQAIDQYLNDAVEQQTLSASSKTVYRPKLRKMAQYITEHNPSIDTLTDTYKDALKHGTFDAPKSHHTAAATTAKHMTVILQSILDEC